MAPGLGRQMVHGKYPSQVEKTKGCEVDRVCYMTCVIYLWLFETSSIGYFQTCGPLPSVSWVGGWQACTGPLQVGISSLDHLSWSFCMLHGVEGLIFQNWKGRCSLHGSHCKHRELPFEALAINVIFENESFLGLENMCMQPSFLVTLLDSYIYLPTLPTPPPPNRRERWLEGKGDIDLFRLLPAD